MMKPFKFVNDTCVTHCFLWTFSSFLSIYSTSFFCADEFTSAKFDIRKGKCGLKTKRYLHFLLDGHFLHLFFPVAIIPHAPGKMNFWCLYEPTITWSFDEVSPRLCFGVRRWHWLVCLLLVCEMVLNLGVEGLEIGPRPIYLLENNFEKQFIF